MKYLISTSICWADEFDVNFIEVLSEAQKRIYMAMKKVYGDWYSSYYFGTNEGWDENFDYLNFDLIEISDEEANVINKYHLTGETIFDRIIDMLWDEISDLDLFEGQETSDVVNSLYTKTEEELIEFFTKLKESFE